MGFVEDQVRGTRSASDADLVQRSLSGNDDAFRELAERYDGMIRGIIRRFGKELGREEDDLAQNALLTAHRKLTNLRDAGRFDTWLWGITARICGKRAARLRQSSTSLQDVQEPVARDDGLTAVERMELRGRIAAALLDLPDHYRSVVVLRYLDGLTHAEIAKSLELSEGQVRSHLYRGTRRLRDRLQSIWEQLYPEEGQLLPVEVREVLEHHPGSVMVISDDLEILAVNRPYSCETGFTEEEVVGKHCYEVNHGVSKPCDPKQCPLHAIGDSDREVHVLHRHRVKSGKWHEAETVAFPVDELLADGSRRRFFVELTTHLALPED